LQLGDVFIVAVVVVAVNVGAVMGTGISANVIDVTAPS
jgi:hypothetical protein